MTVQAQRAQADPLVDGACALADAHDVEPPPAAPLDIYRSLSAMPMWLEHVRRYCSDPDPPHSRAADWLLDNDYHITRAVRQVREDLPVNFYRRLPVVRDPNGDRVPRVYAIAHAVLNASRLQLSLSTIVTYFDAYQSDSILTIAELWAVPSMLRLAALELVADAFHQLNSELAPPFVPGRFAVDCRTRDETERISRAIANLDAIGMIQWRDFFEQTSKVEAILTSDPSAVYARMDADTRDGYRKIVEALADGSSHSETEVAQRAVEFCREAIEGSCSDHVGYWLVDEGRPALEEALQVRIAIGQRLRRLVHRHNRGLYAISLIAVGLAALAVPAIYLAAHAASPAAWIIGMLLSLIPGTVLSVMIVHWLITTFSQPELLPMLDFRKGIPKSCATVVAVPVIVAGADEISEIEEKLEIRRLANPDPRLRFVLLSDLTDAGERRMPGDEQIEAALVGAIRRLNAGYPDGEGGPFFLMHRARQFNPAEQCWMGWERKRGKIEQFNGFLLGADSNNFSLCEGDVERLRGTRFVISLDADTSLPPEAATRLVGALAHPLNSARFDADTGRVVSGYTVLQPHIEVLPAGGRDSLFYRLYSGDSAIDIYTHAISDVYQDLFGTGIYVGKGIYEVATFQRCLENRVPENAILSHDLFEGIHGRTGLVSNIVLYETFPGTYLEFALRLHRWIRGDWQLVPWIGRRARTRDGRRIENTLSLLDRWKLVDNLRRSLISPALLLFIIGGWMVLPGSAWVWTLLAIAAPGAYLVGELFTGLSHGIRHGIVGNLLHRFSEKGGRWFLTIVFLVSDTFITIDAVLRTLWRLLVSRGNLLQWKTAAHTAAMVANGGSRTAAWRFMWPSSVFTAVLAVDLALFDQNALLPAVPLLVLWFLAPEIATWISRPRLPREDVLRTEERLFLERIARRTWHFFERFAGPEDNWLPPDNFQEDPDVEVAHRTSPTNIGLFLVSSLSARDLGFIGTSDFSSRVRNAFDAMDRLKTYRGHVLNWYDTRTLEPLEPQYVSTVDSGNLAVCLLALKHGLEEAASAPPVVPDIWKGLICTFELLAEAVGTIPGVDSNKLADFETGFRHQIADAAHSQDRLPAIIDHLASDAWPEFEQFIGKTLSGTAAMPTTALGEVHVWLERFGHQLHALRREIDGFLPWLFIAMNPPAAHEELARQVVRILSPSTSMQVTTDGARRCSAMIEAALSGADRDKTADPWLRELQTGIADGVARQEAMRTELLVLAERAEKSASAMDFSLLYNPETRLFRIGYNVSAGQMDSNHYDLLASEARLASFFAIAKHDVPVEHWFFLGRPVTRLSGKPSLLSWNGSMFEYLMPPLLLPGRRDTLLGESGSAAVDIQRRYARDGNIPWGISESAFGVTDAEGNYQYRAFGVPGLGIRRGLSEDMVIAPYASALALCARPKAAVQNLKMLRESGANGRYGFIDALDFTPRRAPVQTGFIPVRTYMAHHQGMTILAISNALRDDIHVKRVLSDKRMHAVEYLLQERLPWDVPVETGRAGEMPQDDLKVSGTALLAPWQPSADVAVPQMQLLGNGSMAAWISEAGGGRLLRKQTALTRWSPDPTRDHHGFWIYVRDTVSGALWSVGRHPTAVAGGDARVVFHQHMVEMHRQDQDITLRMEATIAPDDDVDVRRITVANEGGSVRMIELTSYAEVVLAPPLDDERHPAFSKLFVGSSYLADRGGLLFSRRPRRPETHPPVLLHRLVADDPGISIAEYETDRRSFIGRNGTMRRPRGIIDGLSRTTGWTLDPVMALQVRLQLKPREVKQFSFVTITGDSEGTVLEIAERYASPAMEWVFRDSAREAAREVNRLEIDPARLPELQALASALVQPHAALRAVPADISADVNGQPDLWRFGISGDLPILLLRMGDEHASSLLDLLLRAQQLWRRGGLRVDLVILRTGTAGYEEPLRERILSILRDAHAYGFLGRDGGVHLVSADHMDAGLKRGLEAAAHVVLDDEDAGLGQRLDSIIEHPLVPPLFEPAGAVPTVPLAPLETPSGLEFDNEYGGFDRDSGEYVIGIEAETHTPAPWCNVLANDQFGTIVSESGLGFTWAVNSGEHRLTPWANDPVADTPGEILYIRDEITAQLWTATPAPLGHDAACRIHHGAGYTIWLQQSHGLEQEQLVFVPQDATVKIVRLRLRNPSDRGRRITATYYAEWLLGALGSASKPHVRCAYDAATHAIVANNGWNPEFAKRVAFLSSSRPPHSVTGDRHVFLGREGDVQHPAAMGLSDLGGQFTPGGDACAAYQVHLDIAPGETAEVVFVLGEGADRDEAAALIDRWKSTEQAESAIDRLRDFWEEKLGAVQVATPDAAFDLMTNRWLLYQTMSSRLMARAGYYQAGGAYGYRDQLQDVLALLISDPARVRAHIIRAAAHQFEDGDAQHWWHPPSGRGVRTHCSDDYLWLPFVTGRYVDATGDLSVLDVEAPFLTAPPLRPDEHDRYARFDSGETASIFDHCSRALDRMMAYGAHGLPLIGTGDWNDGMDRVGDRGRGESVWLAWFQIATVGQFAPLAVKRGRKSHAERWRRHARKLKKAIEESAWDGEWFVRAFDDEGELWGSHRNDECSIDSISQSWSVLSGSSSDPKAEIAVNSAAERLVHHRERLVQLLDPAFHSTPRDPGYIKAYPPGIRENGGQYTHAATWLGLAFAGLGDGDKAWQIFDLINPIRRTATKADAEHYAREPYVLTGDVTGPGPSAGQGGWSWYTGASGWAWQLAVEAILGLRLRNGALHIAPCLPKHWGRAEAEIRHANGRISIRIEDPEHAGRGVAWMEADGKRVRGETVRFPGRNRSRHVVVRLGSGKG